MNRIPLVGIGLLVLACGTTGPSSPLPGYLLFSIDGDPLPVPFTEDGAELVSAGLGFRDGSRPRSPGLADGTVSYTILVLRPGQGVERSTVNLNYSIRDGVLRIDLCPPLASCIVSSELVGPIAGPLEDLVLTHYLAGHPGQVYRFLPALPE